MRRFFIIGCQRSGTTLLRLILDSHSKIYCYDEYLAYRRLRDGNAGEAEGCEWVGYKIPRWTEQLNNPILSDEGHDIVANRFYSGEPIIFMMRDVRDVVLSMARLKLHNDCGEASWLDSWGLRILAAKSQEVNFKQRYKRELDLAVQDKYAAGALYWKFKTDSYLDYMGLGWPVVALKYEHLATESVSALRAVTTFIGVQWESTLLNHDRLIHSELDGQGQAIGGTDPQRSIDNVSVGRWRALLPQSAIDSILSVAGDLNSQFY